MTKSQILLLGAAVMLCGTTAAEGAAQSATARIAVRRPVTIAQVRDLDFGRMASTATAGTVTLDPNNSARSTTGGVILAGGSPQSARFRVAASPNTLVLITRNALPVLTRAGGGATMPVTLLTMNGAVNPVTTPASGTFDVDIGGVLSVGANQADGTYSGTFQINADYQ